MIRVLVVDDQDLVRAGAVASVGAQPDMEVVGEAATGVDAVREAMLRVPDVVLMDIRMPQLDGIDATRQILDRHPEARVLVLTTFDVDEYVFAALRAGASGFLLKDASVEELAAAIRAVHRGDSVLSPSTTGRLVELMLPVVPDPGRRAAAEAALTDRELTIVRLVARGLSNAEIGGTVFLAEATVKTHVGRVLTKLGVRDRVQVVIWAYQNGLVGLSG
ncbi:response regulator [Promicromonospora iranensis]|jgi:DNA-binding NarL/FixJ family response regulator|uniref:response regulator n=1 Tax=Promicromonospora iranensis TaxID=1105144 RepID=UPI0023A950B1|nr:response regulator transcription factor [Promicromonospora iranensis]